jgi:hypothetical protein
MEREKKLRELQVVEDLERDLALVRAEAAKDLRDRWRALANMGAAEAQANSTVLPELLTSNNSTAPLSEADLYELKLKLHDTLRTLNDNNLMLFAEFVQVLQPDAIKDDAVSPSAFSLETIRPVLSFALQLQAQQTINNVINRDSDVGAADADGFSADNLVINPRPPSAQAPSEDGKPVFAQGQSAAAPPGMTAPELKHREELSNRIFHLPNAKQKEVCSWLQSHSPQAITTTTNIDTQYLMPEQVKELETLLEGMDGDAA